MVAYKYSANDAQTFSKHGIDLTLYAQKDPSVTVAQVHVDRGHFQEFYNVRSSFVYYVIEGRGVFYLDGEAISVLATDLVVVQPHTRIYYFGSMTMLLIVTPAFAEEDERHVRFVDDGEYDAG
jgi:mannose-6-phosphate isomerase-like protein (cupin superfamily)